MASRIEKLIDQFEPKLRDAFLAAFEEINGRADVARMVAAIERGDIADAIEALHLAPEAFNDLMDQLSEGFKAGGMDTMASLPKLRDDAGQMVIRFNARNERAEQILRQYSSEFVTEIITDQRTAIQAALEAGMKAGQNPRAVALDIVGRINPSTGRREGGIVGLTSTQEEWSRNAQAELASTDPKLLRNYLQRAARDKRFDAVVRKAIEKGTPIDPANAARMVQRYRDRLLRIRGETIGRTEALTSLHMGQDEGLQQIIDSGAVEESAVGSIWRTSIDGRERATHHKMNGQFQKHGHPFISPSGARLRFPGDPRAPAAEIIQCRCWREPKIDFFKGIR